MAPRFFLILAVTAGVLLLSLGLGSTSLLPWTDRSLEIVFRFRLPRVLLTFLVGGALSLSGLLCQLTLQNPLSDPYLLGISSGATIGAVVSLACFHLGGAAVSGWSFLGGLGGLVLTLAACGRRRWTSPVSLLLSGTVVSFFLSAVALLTISSAQAADLPGIIFWLAGDCSQADLRAVLNVGLALLPAVAFSLLKARDLEVLETGDEAALSLGVATDRVRGIALVTATLATAAAVATVGMIGFVGLMVPHATRGILGYRARTSSLGALLIGGAVLTLADLLARTVLPYGELPVGAVTALIGCPFFIVILRKGRINE